MSDNSYRYIGQGVYSLPEASRLIGIPRPRIRRWLEGYTFRSSGRSIRSGPVIASAIGRDTGELALTFADLLEIRFLDAFIEKGVSLRTVRLAVEAARETLGTDRPFSSRRFMTDGKTILAEIVGTGRGRHYLDLAKSQFVFQKVIKPFLVAGVEFDDFDTPSRWWPLTRRKLVLVDPERSFGAPIVSIGGVPTRVLAASAKAERSATRAAKLYDVPVRAVRDALEFERRLSA
jgi:hypothetical protein